MRATKRTTTSKRAAASKAAAKKATSVKRTTTTTSKATATSKHPGFEKVAEKVAREEGISMKSARAIVASSTRKAKAATKQENTRLKKVKGA